MKAQNTQSSQNESVQQPQQQQEPSSQSIQYDREAAMIATANNNNNNNLMGGGVWIDSRRHEDDGGTVISEITSDHTMFTTTTRYGDDAFDDLLCCLNEVREQTGSGIGSVDTPPSLATNNFNHNDKMMIGVSATTTPTTTTATSPTTASGTTPRTNKIDDGSFTDKPPSSSTTKSNSTASESTKPTATTGAAANKNNNNNNTTKPKAKTTTSASKTAGAAAKTAAKKKAPPPPAAAATSTTRKAAAAKPPSPKTVTIAPTTTTKTSPKTVIARTSVKASAPPPLETWNVNNNNSMSTAAAVVTPNNKPTTTTTTVPTTTTTSGDGSGKNVGCLSELSKQLRVQRAKNEWQHNEIARLERQLRILSDLKGVSVAELRFSLESACAEEAHDELRNQVQSLQAQLEALQAQRESARRRASTATTEAAQSKIATLQLRIGELEEVDQAKQAEVRALYRQLQDQTARATTSEAAKCQAEDRVARFEQVARAYVRDVETVQAERDALKERVAELTQQLHDQQAARNLDLEMRDIETQIQLEQARKQEYLALARKEQQQQQQQQQRRVGGGGNNNKDNNTPVSRRISESQFAAIQGIVGRQAGVAMPPPTGHAADASTIATTSVLVGGEGGNSHYVSSVEMSANGSSCDGADDDVSHLGDYEMDMSVGTMDVLMMQGLSEEHAKAAVEKDAKITSLLEELRGQTTRASRLQTLCANQKAQLERFAEQLNEKEEIVKSTQSNYDFAKTEHDSLYERFCDIELQLTLEQEKVEGLERQLNARNNENNLRNEQFKCRFQVQNERIADLEQQQQSLYVAFQLLQQEVKAQDNEHNKLKSSLDEADSEVARQLRESEKKARKGRRSSATNSDHHLASPDASRRNLFENSQSNLNVQVEEEIEVEATPVSPYMNDESAYSMLDESASSYMLQEQTPQQQGIDHPMRMYGYLWKLDKIKGWKRRFFVLYGEGGVYRMTYADGPRERLKGTINDITMGVSTVAETNKSMKKPFSFVLHVNPLQHHAPVLYAAAMNADDFRKWMNALKAATIRPEDSFYMSLTNNNLSYEAQLDADAEIARQLQSSSSAGDLNHDPNHESQIESDHLMAMRLHIQNQPNQAFA